jgi:hypothetical protein
MQCKKCKVYFVPFYYISGLNINFYKSEIFFLAAAKVRSQQYSEIFTCPGVELAIKYLGMPIHKKKLGRKETCFVEIG